jgi:taurine dioxygenase
VKVQEVQRTSDYGNVTIRPFAAALGAEIVCGDLRAIGKREAETIYRAWLDHLVILIRDQTLTDDDLVAITQHFGELKTPLARHQRAANVRDLDNRNISVISNVMENGIAIGSLGDGEALWHTDYNFNETPYAAAMLYAIEVPPSGGNTGWSNMYAAYETLPQGLRERIHDLTIKHDDSYNAAGILRRGYAPVTDVRRSPGPSHPIVRTHPETGRNCLYLGRRLHSYVNGLSVEDSEALLDALWAHAEQPQFQWHHQWRPGDLIVWDNRCTMHHRDAFDPGSRRIMHKTQTVGDRPFHSPAADGLTHPRAALAGGA